MLVTLKVAWTVTSCNLPAAFGFLAIGIAASCGTLRFFMSTPSHNIVELHSYMSWLATVAGLPCIAVGFHHLHGATWAANIHMATAIAAVSLRHRAVSGKALEIVSVIVSNGAVLSILALTIMTSNIYGILGTVIYTISGLVIKTTGAWVGIPRVDLFHYALALGNVALLMGIQTERQPIYYSPHN